MEIVDTYWLDKCLELQAKYEKVNEYLQSRKDELLMIREANPNKSHLIDAQIVEILLVISRINKL